MKLRLIGLLLITVVVCGCGGTDVDYEAIARDFEMALNAGDGDALISMWSSEGGWVELYMNPEDTSDLILCEGLLSECWRNVFGRSEFWRFTEYRPGIKAICFQLEFSEDNVSWTKATKGGEHTQLQFEGDKINNFSWGCRF